MTEFIVIELNVLESECNVLFKCDSETNALRFMNTYVNKKESEYSDDEFYRKCIDTERKISVFQLHYLFKKTLIYRYFIEEYQRPLFIIDLD